MKPEANSSLWLISTYVYVILFLYFYQIRIARHMLLCHILRFWNQNNLVLNCRSWYYGWRQKKKTWRSFALWWGSHVIPERLAAAALTPWFSAPGAVSLFWTENDKQPICWSASKAEAAGVHALSFINEATCQWQPGNSKEVLRFLPLWSLPRWLLLRKCPDCWPNEFMISYIALQKDT